MTKADYNYDKMVHKWTTTLKTAVVLFAALSASTTLVSAAQIYCPQHAGYINTGMTVNEVIGACGQPLSKQPLNRPVMQRIPVKQLIYTAINTGSVYPGLNSAFYDQWSLPSGTPGISLEVTILDDKVTSVKINGSSTNAMNLCSGQNVQIGDRVNQVYNACGSPTMVNDSYINQPIRSAEPPEVWIYQFDQYRPPVSLTFVNGKLQSIN